MHDRQLWSSKRGTPTNTVHTAPCIHHVRMASRLGVERRDVLNVVGERRRLRCARLGGLARPGGGNAANCARFAQPRRGRHGRWGDQAERPALRALLRGLRGGRGGELWRPKECAVHVPLGLLVVLSPSTSTLLSSSVDLLGVLITWLCMTGAFRVHGVGMAVCMVST